ncbi:mechanosensitive ion channel protein 6-like protein [Cinnamomum micranthum f. kanehirae]|uniref:Mechanosensitive ion channel protein n=1 Tax=Cinnamomum micranthum f. kanehirae TaxID=337451 RepID=A0A443NL93_9MAGN|nr:mechanosensitive ion channel protein 6-like protein [Cinnamomum micranthum f. kanehirae]
MGSLKKSFKKLGSQKSICKKSVAGQEERPILFDVEEYEMESNHKKEVVVKIDKSRDMKLAMEPEKSWKEGSHELSSDIEGREQQQRNSDGQLYFRQKEVVSGSEEALSRHVELEMEELILDQLTPPATGDQTEQQWHTSSKELRVSFQSPSLSMKHIDIGPETIKRRSKDHTNGEDDKQNPDAGEVLKCSTSPRLLQTKTKSRLIDAHPIENNEAMISGQSISGSLRKTEDDEDDPFLDEDLPRAFKESLNAGYILQWVILNVIVAAFICTLTIPFLTEVRVYHLLLWEWEVLVLVLICGRLVSGWWIRIIVFFIERNFLLRKRLLYFVYSLRKAVQNFLWLNQVLIAWHYIFIVKEGSEIKSKTLPYVTKILFCLLVGTMIWLVKTLLVKVLASSFHVSTYFDRIQDSLFNQFVIEKLSGPPVIENESGVLEGKSISLSRNLSKHLDDRITIEHIHKLKKKNISAWNMKRLMKIVRNGTLSTLDERITNITQEAVEIQSEYEAKAAAKRIFTNVAKRGSKYIYLVDLMRFMKEDEARKTMSLFQGSDESKKVNKNALKEWVVNAFRERRALSLTLNDTKTAVNRLHQMVNFIVGIVIFVIWLLILEIATSQLLVLISSQLMLVVFIFGNTCKTVFEAIIFLFVMHPFDVGDRCEIEGVQMIVEEMNILTTVFLRYDNQKIAYPNSQLSTQPISNYYRSPDMGEAIDFCVHVSTSLEKIGIMRERVKEWIEGKKEHWYPNPMIVMKDVVDMNKLQFAVWSQHRMNHQNMGERWARRSCLVEHMIEIFRELDIEFRMLPVDINLRKMPEMTSSRFSSTWTTCA